MQKAQAANSTGVVPPSSRASGQRKENGKDIQKSQGQRLRKNASSWQDNAGAISFPVSTGEKPTPATTPPRHVQQKGCSPGVVEAPASTLQTQSGAKHARMAHCLKIDVLLFPGSCVRALKPLKLQLSYPFPIGVHFLAVTARVPAPTAGRGTPLSSVTEALLPACTSPYRHQHLCYLQGWRRTYSLTLLQETRKFKRFFLLASGCKVVL